MLIEYFKFAWKKWFKKLRKKKINQTKCIVLARDISCSKNIIRFNSTVIASSKKDRYIFLQRRSPWRRWQNSTRLSSILRFKIKLIWNASILPFRTKTCGTIVLSIPLNNVILTRSGLFETIETTTTHRRHHWNQW